MAETTSGTPAGDGTSIDAFPIRSRVPVRWSDIDMYGHVNNAVYYQWFDSVINIWLLEEAGVDPNEAEIVGVVGESACSFESEVCLGDEVEIGLAVSAIGSSSITYVLAAFVGPEKKRAAIGHWVHVYVKSEGGTAPVPQNIATTAEAARADLAPMRLRKL